VPIQGLRRTCRNHARAYLAKHNPKTIFLVGQTHLLLELEDHETPVIIVEPVAKTNQQAMASCKNTRHFSWHNPNENEKHMWQIKAFLTSSRCIWLVVSNPSEQYEFVNGKDYPTYIYISWKLWKNKSHIPNHQPDNLLYIIIHLCGLSEGGDSLREKLGASNMAHSLPLSLGGLWGTWCPIKQGETIYANGYIGLNNRCNG
jgi:hypothetical protein